MLPNRPSCSSLMPAAKYRVFVLAPNAPLPNRRPQRPSIWIGAFVSLFSWPRKLPSAANALILPSPKLPTSTSLWKLPKLEGASARPLDVIMLLGVLHRVSDKHLPANVLNPKGREHGGDGRVGEGPCERRWLKIAVENVDRSKPEIRGIKEIRRTNRSNRQSLVDRSQTNRRAIDFDTS